MVEAPIRPSMRFMGRKRAAAYEACPSIFRVNVLPARSTGLLRHRHSELTVATHEVAALLQWDVGRGRATTLSNTKSTAMTILN